MSFPALKLWSPYPKGPEGYAAPTLLMLWLSSSDVSQSTLYPLSTLQCPAFAPVPAHAEGLKAALALARLPADKVGQPIPAERLYDCVNVILSYQVRPVCCHALLRGAQAAM